jgi:hypothetical protein
VLIEDIASLDGLERYIMNQSIYHGGLDGGNKNSQEWDDKYILMAHNFYEYHTIYQIISFWRSILKANVFYSILLRKKYFNLLRKITFLKPKVAAVLISRTIKWWNKWRTRTEIIHVF